MTELPIILPPGFTTLVKEGDIVFKGQTLAEKNAQETKDIQIADLLEVPIRKARLYLRKDPGDSVLPGDVVARKKGFFGITEKWIVSESSGIVSGFERSTGVLSILEQADGTDAKSATSLISPIDGTVVLCNNEQIVLKTDKNIVTAVAGIGDRVEGELIVISGDESGEVIAHQLDVNIIGKVVFGGSLSREVLLKAIGMEALGVIAVHADNEDLVHIEKRNIKTPVLIVPIEQTKTLLKWVGKTVIVDGQTKSILLGETEKK